MFFAGQVVTKPDGQVDENNAVLINDACPAAVINSVVQWQTASDVAKWSRENRGNAFAIATPNRLKYSAFSQNFKTN